MTTPPVPRKALVDSDFLAYRVGFASQGENEALAKARLTDWLNDLLFTKLDVDDYKLYLTGHGNFRDDIAKTVKYKGNRDGFVKPEHHAALRAHMVARYGAITVDGIEADDAVAMDSVSGEWIIVGVDKDLDQLEGHHYNPVKNEHYYVSEFEGLRSFYTQLLMGDRTDNIPGLHKVGKVTAGKILAEATTKEQLEEAVWKAYQERGHGIEYLTEQGRLLWLLRSPDDEWKPSEETIKKAESSRT